MEITFLRLYSESVPPKALQANAAFWLDGNSSLSGVSTKPLFEPLLA